jgi:hypothetical protein
MDPHVSWLRRRILGDLIQRVASAYGLAVAGCLVVLRLTTDFGVLAMVAWAVVGAQVLAAGLVVWAAATNPLSYRYLRHMAANPYRLSLVAATSAPPELIEELSAHTLVPLATIWDISDGPQPVSDLFQTPQASVMVARHRALGSLSLLSRLDDGRILVTDPVRTSPHRRLVVNVAPSGDLKALLEGHLHAIDRLKAADCLIEAVDAGLFVEASAIEQEAFDTLGPYLGPFYNLLPEAAPLRFLVSVSAGELMDLALDPIRLPVRPVLALGHA